VFKLRALGLLVVGFALFLPASAFATGTIRMQQHDKSVETYAGVVMKIKANMLELTSPDGVSTVEVGVIGGDCAPTNGVVYCTGGKMSLLQHGKMNVIPLKAAKFYVNSTNQEQSSDALAGVLSAAGCPVASKVGPHTVVFAVLTQKGTHIIGNGKLD
jgi:hypothetical protein